MKKPKAPQKSRAPSKPQAPAKTLKREHILWESGWGSTFPLSEILKNLRDGSTIDDVMVRPVDHDNDDYYSNCNCSWEEGQIFYTTEFDNPDLEKETVNYKKAKARYEKKLVEHKAMLKAWKSKNDKHLEKLKVWEEWSTEEEIKALEKKLKGLKT